MSSLSAQLSATEQYAASVLQPAVAEADASVAALEAQLSAARALQAQRASDLAKVTEQIRVLRARVAELSPPPSGEGRIWSVSDCHSHCSSGAWALEATESGSYGVCVSSSFTEGANVSLKLVNGQSVPVSKRRYDAAKDIRVGDTLYMGDKKRAAVFKGIVTGQTVTGLFNPADPSVNSFRRRVGDHALTDSRPLTYEVEMMWEVKWERVGDLTEAAKKALLYSQRRTVRPLSAHPTF
jgi:hypothetical protein